MSSLVVPPSSLQPVDWKKAEDAVSGWASDTLGGIGFIWENQNVPQPAFPYLSLMRQDEVDEGGIDEKRYRTIADDGTVMLPGSTKTPFENEEIIYQPITFAITIQAHVDFAHGSTDPSANAKALLSRLKRSLGLTSVVDRLYAAGLSIVRSESVVGLDLITNGEWLSRAAFDVRFRTASVMTERVGFIEKVELKSSNLRVDVVIDAS